MAIYHGTSTSGYMYADDGDTWMDVSRMFCATISRNLSSQTCIGWNACNDSRFLISPQMHLLKNKVVVQMYTCTALPASLRHFVFFFLHLCAVCFTLCVIHTSLKNPCIMLTCINESSIGCISKKCKRLTDDTHTSVPFHFWSQTYFVCQSSIAAAAACEHALLNVVANDNVLRST